jgi:hypothetical protein
MQYNLVEQFESKYFYMTVFFLGFCNLELHVTHTMGQKQGD